MTMDPVGHTLTHLADRLSRLSPCHRDPHAYHDGKRAIVNELRRLARQTETTNPNTPIKDKPGDLSGPSGELQKHLVWKGACNGLTRTRR